MELDGKQYVAVVSGRTHSIPPFLGAIEDDAASPEGGTLLVFELPAYIMVRPSLEAG